MCYVILVKSTFLPKLSLMRNENFLRAVMSIPQNVVFNIINAFISFKQEQFFRIQDFPKSTFLAKPRQSLWDRVVHRIRGYKCKPYHQIHGQSHYYLHSCYIGQYFGEKEKKLELFTWRENLYLYLKRTANLMEKFTGVFLMCVLLLLIRERKVLRTARISVMCMCSFILLNKSSQNISLSTSRI